MALAIMWSPWKEAECLVASCWAVYAVLIECHVYSDQEGRDSNKLSLPSLWWVQLSITVGPSLQNLWTLQGCCTCGRQVVKGISNTLALSSVGVQPLGLPPISKIKGCFLFSSFALWCLMFAFILVGEGVAIFHLCILWESQFKGIKIQLTSTAEHSKAFMYHVKSVIL